MKREIYIHLIFMASFFIFVVILRNYFNIYYILLLYLGGVVGTFLPNVDHLFYAYFLRPEEHISQRIRYLISERNFPKLLEFMAETKSERPKLIFHTVFFQIIFLILTFLVLTSSGNIFGVGLVLAFSLHLLVDQLIDLIKKESLDNWFIDMPIIENLNGIFGIVDKKKSTLYWVGVSVFFVVFALFY